MAHMGKPGFQALAIAEELNRHVRKGEGIRV